MKNVSFNNRNKQQRIGWVRKKQVKLDELLGWAVKSWERQKLKGKVYRVKEYRRSQLCDGRIFHCKGNERSDVILAS